MISRVAAYLRSLERLGRLPTFEIVSVRSVPDDPMRCLLYQDGDTVKAVINEAHGDEAWDHAAYHGAAPVVGLTYACAVGEPCGYAGDPTYLARMAQGDEWPGGAD
jgi:hypothetical protein